MTKKALQYFCDKMFINIGQNYVTIKNGVYMKLLHKLLLGYIFIIVIIGSFSTFALIYGIQKSSHNLSIYREREITSFVHVVDAFIVNEESLEDLDGIESLFISITKKLPHIKRITLHLQDKNTSEYSHVVSTVLSHKNLPSHPEDIDAIINNKTTILYETGDEDEKYIDITYPITNEDGKAIASMGVAVLLTESDAVLQKAIDAMKEEAVVSVLMAVLFSLLIASVFVFLMTKKIIAPIEKLKAAAKSISNNEAYEVIEEETDDEIGELAGEFNKMAYELHTLHSSMQEQINAKTQALEDKFLIDELLNIPNRKALFLAFDNTPVFDIAILDVASFKDINDVYGVELGNKVLQKLTRTYKRLIADTGIDIYRISGDEVVLFNVLVQSQEEFVVLIEEIINTVEHETFYFMQEDVEIHLSLHAGISFEHDHAIEKANIALIKAKQEHLDYVVYKDESFQANAQVESLDMIKKIKNAIANYDFIAYYQPIVDRDQNVIKYEALVRMRDDMTVLSPFYFLDIAKKTKYYQHITRAVLVQALKDFQDKDLYISINLSADDITNIETQNFIKKYLEVFGQPEKVVFELVESEDLYELSGLKEFIAYVREIGAKIAIDDFGTGYSNFSYLLELEPDYIKIDGSLIKNVDTDIKSYNIVKMIVNMAHASNITVVAEFVHSKEVLQVCQELEVDEFQGYYFGEPAAVIQ